MLATLQQVMNLCEARCCAAGSFNTPNLEAVMAVIGAAEELDVPVIIQHAQVHESVMPLDVIGPIMVDMASRAKVPVCVHLDHGETLEYLCRALDLGFTSIMYDGSVLPYEENAANTKMAVSFAAQTGAGVEAELGCMGRREEGDGSALAGKPDPDKIYTDPDLAAQFVAETGIDALACSFGTTHGVYLTEPKLDFSVVERVRARTRIPVVMHGGSGVSDEDYRKAIRSGVRKINYYTYMAMAGGAGVASRLLRGCTAAAKGGALQYCYTPSEEVPATPLMYHDVVTWGMQAMKADCRRAMKVFSMREDD